MFHPEPHMEIQIGDLRLRFVQDHRFVDTYEVIAQQGTEADVYQMFDEQSQSLWALKVPLPGFRNGVWAMPLHANLQFHDLPGLYALNRWRILRDTFPEVVKQFPDLEFAILMPWIEGRSWAGYLFDREWSEHYTQQHAFNLVAMTAHSLAEMERHGLVHSDIAGSNLIITSDLEAIEWVDLDRIYYANAQRPAFISFGSAGYAHPHLNEAGQWCQSGDRFAGAILLTEMLVWCDPEIRANTPVQYDTLFSEDELQSTSSTRWDNVRDSLYSLKPFALKLFDQAWRSQSLEECPKLEIWEKVILS